MFSVASPLNGMLLNPFLHVISSSLVLVWVIYTYTRVFFTDGHWGPNTKMFVNAVGMHPDRLTNMYFAYVFMLRAIGKARPFLMVRKNTALRRPSLWMDARDDQR